VPKYLLSDDGGRGERNDVTLAGINHKMGFRGTVNTAPVFGDGAFAPGGRHGAVGYLVGDLHGGLPVMFSMMNEARISVGLCATALGYTGYLKSLAYARERLQGRPAGASPTTAQVPIVAHPDVRRMLLAQKSYVEGALALSLFSARLVDDAATLTGVEAEDATRLLGLITPIAKSWPSQWCLAANDLAIQVMGGAGYTRDYDVEQHYRDNRLNPIHEGTHGIQALDLLGRKVLADGGVGLALLASRILSTAERAAASGPDGAALAGHLKSASVGWSARPSCSSRPTTGPLSWPKRPPTWRPPVTSSSPGSGSSNGSPRSVRRTPSTRASGWPPGTSSRASCPGSITCWMC